MIDKNTLSIITTNRQSAFNKIICEIENKCLIQTLFTNFWFNKTKYIIDNHVIKSYDNVLIDKKCNCYSC